MRLEIENIKRDALGGLSEFEIQFENMEQLDKPNFWGGYRLVPDYYEFWQGRPNRLHDRICYQKQDCRYHEEFYNIKNGMF